MTVLNFARMAIHQHKPRFITTFCGPGCYQFVGQVVLPAGDEIEVGGDHFFHVQYKSVNQRVESIAISCCLSIDPSFHHTGFVSLSQSQLPKSVTFCITELDVGGAEKALVRIAIGLLKKGWCVRVISLRDAGELAKPLTNAGIDVVALGCGSFADVRTYFRLVAELKNHTPDILVCFLHQANIYGRLAARRLGLPSVSGIRVADRRWSVVWPERLTRRCATQYVAVGLATGRVHSQLCRIPPDRMISIPNGVDIPPETCQTADASAKHGLLFVGRLTAQKAPLNLLEAFAMLPTELRQKTRLTFAGDGELRHQLDARIAELGLSEAVEVLGQCSNVNELMRKATLLVLPSLWEGMPNVVLEAMAAKLPVVATAVDGTTDLICDGKNGWLVPAGDPSALSAAIAEALTSPALRRTFAESAQTTVIKGFSWESVIARYERLLDSMLGNSAT